MKGIAIDDGSVLSFFFDDREMFVVDFDVRFVKVDLTGIEKGEVIFRLKKEVM